VPVWVRRHLLVSKVVAQPLLQFVSTWGRAPAFCEFVWLVK
jgi:hypothetical protein